METPTFLEESGYTVSKPTYEKKAEAVQQAAAGMASLDFELPTNEDSRWTLYHFASALGAGNHRDEAPRTIWCGG